MTNKYSEIVNSAKSELSQKYSKYKDITQERTEPIIVKTRKHIQIDFAATMKRMEERLNRFCIPIFSCASDTLIDSLYYNGVCVADSEFRLVTASMTFTDNLSTFKFRIETTGLRISSHAVERWLERNESEDYKKALSQLGDSVCSVYHQLMNKLFGDGKEVYGYQERVVPCKDGGFSFISIENPEVKDFVLLDGIVKTYISSDMVMAWNEKKAKANFSGIYDYNLEEHLKEQLPDSVAEECFERLTSAIKKGQQSK